MKLSEGIRLGATINKQGFGQFINCYDETCAIGAAITAVGLHDETDTDDSGRTYLELFPLLNAPAPACPEGQHIWSSLVCDGLQWVIMESLIIHLNDSHRWTREQIADWVELQEDLPAPETQTVESPSCTCRTYEHYTAVCPSCARKLEKTLDEIVK